MRKIKNINHNTADSWSFEYSKDLIINQPLLKSYLAFDYIDLEKPCSALELGSGPGKQCHLLPDHVQYTGYDISDVAITQASERFRDKPNIEFFVNSAEDLGDHKYTYIVAQSVIEHLDDPMGVIEELKKICTKRIVLILPLGDRHSLDNMHVWQADLDSFPEASETIADEESLIVVFDM